MKSVLEIRNLSTQNDGVQILHDISFTIQPGEIIGIVGESGCGKSTLIRNILQMSYAHETITKGSILFNEEEMIHLKAEKLRKIMGNEIGVVFQNPGATLNPTRKIGTQFIETLQTHKKISKKEALKKAADILRKMNLRDCECLLESYPFELSGGMKQRVAIALAMVLEPKLLVADEPTSALDVTVQKQVIDEMIKLRDTFSTSILIVTHSMGVISYMVDKVAVMYKGTIVEYGEKEQVLHQPSHEYTARLMAARPQLGSEFLAPIGAEKVILEGKSIYKKYKKKHHDHIAAEDINFKLYKGECLAIVGESGCGKSTLAKMLMNLESVDAGEILLKDRNIANLKGKQLKNVYKEIQMVFQDAVGSLNPKMTIGESIMEYVCSLCSVGKEKRKEKVDELLELVGLSPEFKMRYPHQLSGGQCQRAAIARAISSHPKVLIFDEATSALDVSVQAQVIELLKDMGKHLNISYIFITHDLALVSEFCHRVLVMKDGRIVEMGPVAEVLQAPQSNYTKKLISSII